MIKYKFITHLGKRNYSRVNPFSLYDFSMDTYIPSYRNWRFTTIKGRILMKAETSMAYSIHKVSIRRIRGREDFRWQVYDTFEKKEGYFWVKTSIHPGNINQPLPTKVSNFPFDLDGPRRVIDPTFLQSRSKTTAKEILEEIPRRCQKKPYGNLATVQMSPCSDQRRRYWGRTKKCSRSTSI